MFLSAYIYLFVSIHMLFHFSRQAHPRERKIDIEDIIMKNKQEGEKQQGKEKKLSYCAANPLITMPSRHMLMSTLSSVVR